MAAEPSRLDTLRRRVQQDPASFAFAALAEEYRRLGQLEEAVATCRKGLELHPTYISGRVTLARALMALQDVETAGAEFEEVLKVAPENLAARRGFAEIQRERGDLAGALTSFRLAAGLAPQDPELAQCVASLEQDVASLVLATSHGTPAPTGQPQQRPSISEPAVSGSITAPDEAGELISAEAEPLAGGVSALPGENGMPRQEQPALLHELFWLSTPETPSADPLTWSNEWDFGIAARASAGTALAPGSACADVQDAGATVVQSVRSGVFEDVGPCAELAYRNEHSPARAGADPGSDLTPEPQAAEGTPPSLSLIHTPREASAPGVDLPLASQALPAIPPIAHLQILDDPIDEIDLPLDPRVDALEHFLEAVVRSRSRQ